MPAHRCPCRLPRSMERSTVLKRSSVVTVGCAALSGDLAHALLVVRATWRKGSQLKAHGRATRLSSRSNRGDGRVQPRLKFDTGAIWLRVERRREPTLRHGCSWCEQGAWTDRSAPHHGPPRRRLTLRRRSTCSAGLRARGLVAKAAHRCASPRSA